MPVLETESTCKYHMSFPPPPPSLPPLMAILSVSTIMYRVRGGGGRGEGGRERGWCSAEWRSEGGGGRGEERRGVGGWCSAEWGSEGGGDPSEGVSVTGVRV